MIRKRKNIAISFFIMFLLFIIISTIIGICFFEHDCIEENCNICCGINLLKSILKVVLISLLFYISIGEIEINVRYIQKLKYKLIPVKLGVELLE